VIGAQSGHWRVPAACPVAYGDPTGDKLTMPNGITAPREVIAWNLRAYGETDVAARVLSASDQVLFRIWAEAFTVSTDESVRSFVDHYLARGAVRVITGTDRPLKRKKRLLAEPEPRAEISAETYSRWWAWDGA
jgi:hypothetical protein